MGFKVNRDVPPMKRELIYLLYDLCVIWGFCIPPDDFEIITNADSYDSNNFAKDIIKAEGMDPNETKWTKKIAERFEIRFGKREIEVSTFTDRVRGIKENW